MTGPFAIAALWLALAVLATVLANHLRVSMALVEICVGVAAGAVAAHYFGAESLGANLPWLAFLASHRRGDAHLPGGRGTRIRPCCAPSGRK